MSDQDYRKITYYGSDIEGLLLRRSSSGEVSSRGGKLPITVNSPVHISTFLQTSQPHEVSTLTDYFQSRVEELWPQASVKKFATVSGLSEFERLLRDDDASNNPDLIVFDDYTAAVEMLSRLDSSYRIVTSKGAVPTVICGGRCEEDPPS